MLALWALLYLTASASSVPSSSALRSTVPVVGEQPVQHAPAPLITTLPPQLARRKDDQDFNTCGYFYGDSEKPFGCERGEYCNVDNQYSVAACCVGASTDSDYDPYGCEFTTTCYDSSVSTSVGTKTTGRTDKLIALSCSDATYPYCGTYLFADIRYKNYFCGTERNEIWTIAATSTTQTSLIQTGTASSIVTLTPRTTINSEQTTADLGAVISSTAPSEATGLGSEDQEAENSSIMTGVIIYGSICGLACMVILAATLLALRRQCKRMAQEEPTETSFEVLGSSLHQSPINFQDPNYQHPAIGRTISPPVPYPNPIEASSHIAQPLNVPHPARSPSPDLTPTYQAYNPQHASAGSLASNSFSLGQPALLPQPSFQRASDYLSHTSFMPTVSEVHGQSASNSRASTPTPASGRGGGVRGSRFAERDAQQLSSQSGPVPEWPGKQEFLL